MISSMLYENGLGPVGEPQEVDVFSEGWIFPASLLELGSTTPRDQADTEVIAHSSEIIIKLIVI